MADAQGSFSEEEEVDQFFDSREELSSLSDSCEVENSSNLFDRDPLYQVWIRSPSSIQQRRTMFMKWMGLDQVVRAQTDSIGFDGELMVDDSITVEFDRFSMDCGAVLGGSESENGSLAFPCSHDLQSTSEDRSSDVQFQSRVKNLDDDRVSSAGEFDQDGTARGLLEAGSNQMVTIDEFERRLSPSFLSSNCAKMPTRRIGWLRRLGSLACIADKQDYRVDSCISDYDQSRGSEFQRIRVRSYRKQSKELSAVYMVQNFVAHHGAILTMKFSPDGEYLASGGEDGVVRVWKVMECRRADVKNDIPIDDSSCIYFSMNDNLELSPLHIDKKKMINSKSSQRTSDSACVVIPEVIFQISEKPSYEFHGHNGDVLDLAWSKDLDLLSSSVDKTVRLWKLGCDSCLKVFPHKNYVTSVQFNPTDKRYFISGSIDGKARIWEISTCRVVDWADVRQIITAVCYRPDGKAVVVGSMMGDCRFYDSSDNHLQLDTEVTFQGRKKLIDKRITGFQFCPTNHLQLMVTSADCTVRILHGVDVVSKFKGLRNAGSRISAMFTSNGLHIISASEDSNVYVWNHSNQDHIPSSKHVKSSWSSERFASGRASVAIPWQGFLSKNLQLSGKAKPVEMQEHSIELAEKDYFSASSSFTLWPEFFSEIALKGSATWPEEKLPSSMPNSSSLSKSQLKFLRASWQNSSPHSWGQVIVTAGCDGRIRSFQNYGLPAVPAVRL